MMANKEYLALLVDKGYIKATKKVDPSEWFFNAHFYQDPVCPGSLGVESFLQMIRLFLLEKFNLTGNKAEEYEVQLSSGNSHEWIYRGQIIPKNKKITIHAHIKSVNKDLSVVADGALTVDGICIYEMKNFGMTLIKKYIGNKTLKKNQVSENQEIDLLLKDTDI